MIPTRKKILVLAPHTDDGEFGCGATISKLIENNNEVFYVAFSACEQSVLPDFPSDILITEVKEATKILGIKEDNVILFKYDVRTFNYKRQMILDDLIDLRKTINPDVIFMPTLNDIHQDHSTIAEEGLRTFKTKTIFGYELLWNNLNFKTTAFFELSEEHVNAKLKALGAYRSQAHRPYSDPDFIRSLAKVRGVQIGVNYAECFEVIRAVY